MSLEPIQPTNGRLLYLLGGTRQEVGRIRALSVWEAQRFHTIETAYSARHLWNLLQAEEPDLLLFHLQQGMELLTEIRSRYPHLPIVVYGTSQPVHAQVSALMHLGVLDYLCLPIEESAVLSAMEVLNSQEDVRLLQRQNARDALHWHANRLEIREKFWKDLCLGWIHGSAEEIEEIADTKGVAVDKEAQYRMILSVMKNQDQMWSTWGEYGCQRAIQQYVREIYPDIEQQGTAIVIYSRVVLILGDHTEHEDEERARRLSRQCQEQLGADLYCYFSQPIYCDEIPLAYSLLLSSSKDDVLRSSHIVHVGQRSQDSVDQLSIPQEWSDILSSQRAIQLSTSVRIYLTQAAHDGRLNERNLRIFQQDMLQLFFNYMDSEGLSAHDLYHDRTIYQLYKTAIQSIDGMTEWVSACIRYIQQILGSHRESQKRRTVARIKTVIKSNLAGDLSIENISRMVHLSPDYTGRIFREGTGYTVHQYIVRKRMEYAHTLLRSTNKPISVIAAEVGYSNPSHFISNFRGYYGETPKKMRSSMRSDEPDET